MGWIVFAAIDSVVKKEAILWVLSIVGTYITTRLKRRKLELPPMFQDLLNEGLSYKDLKLAYDSAERFAKGAPDKRIEAVRRLQDIAVNKVGHSLPPALANFAVEQAVQLAKSGWTVLAKKQR